MKTTLTGDRLLAAITAAGLYRLSALSLRLLEAAGVVALTARVAAEGTLSPADPWLWGVLGLWVAEIALLPPLRLGRAAYELALAQRPGVPAFSLLLSGFRHWSGAVGWRWGLWWRRWFATSLCLLPGAFVWGIGDVFAHRGAAVVSLVCGAVGLLLLVPTILGVRCFMVRYALAPLFLLEGVPAGRALRLSARGMAGGRRGYIDLSGETLRRWPLWLLVVPAAAEVVRLRHRRAVFLLERHRRRENEDGERTCIFPLPTL